MQIGDFLNRPINLASHSQLLRHIFVACSYGIFLLNIPVACSCGLNLIVSPGRTLDPAATGSVSGCCRIQIRQNGSKSRSCRIQIRQQPKLDQALPDSLGRREKELEDEQGGEEGKTVKQEEGGGGENTFLPLICPHMPYPILCCQRISGQTGSRSICCRV